MKFVPTKRGVSSPWEDDRAEHRLMCRSLDVSANDPGANEEILKIIPVMRDWPKTLETGRKREPVLAQIGGVRNAPGACGRRPKVPAQRCSDHHRPTSLQMASQLL